jgi:hypothetical protein
MSLYYKGPLPNPTKWRWLRVALIAIVLLAVLEVLLWR